jgi:hypothetical protein
MTKYQQLNDVERRILITKINHSLLYDDKVFAKIMDVVKHSTPTKKINLFPKESNN